MTDHPPLPPSLQVGAFFKQITDGVLAHVASEWPQITPNQLRLLMSVCAPAQLKDIAVQMAMTPSNLTPLVAVCVDKGWLEKLKSDSDGRAVSLHLTSKGRAIRAEMIDQIASLVCTTSGLGEADFAVILRLIENASPRPADPNG